MPNCKKLNHDFRIDFCTLLGSTSVSSLLRDDNIKHVIKKYILYLLSSCISIHQG